MAGQGSASTDGTETMPNKNGKGKGNGKKNTAVHLSPMKSTPKMKKQRGKDDSAAHGGIDPNDGADE